MYTKNHLGAAAQRAPAVLGKCEGYKKAICPLYGMCFILQDYEIGKQLSSQISGMAITTVLEGRKDNHKEEKKQTHTNNHHIA